MTALIAILGGVRATVFAGIAVLALLFAGVQTWRVASNVKALAAADARTNHYAAQTAILAASLAAIDADTATAKAAADQQAKRAKAAESRAAQANTDYRKALTTVEREIANAARDPSCKRTLEMQTCATLR